MSNASVALDSARNYLNDTLGTVWTDTILLPKLQEAHRRLQVKLQLAGIPVIEAVDIVLLVPSGTTDLTTVVGYPTDLIEPTWMKERSPGERRSDFVDMTQSDDVPDLDPDIQLLWWVWKSQKILFIGATKDIEVQLKYKRGIPVPVSGTSDLGFIFAENYLGPKTAALAASATSDPEGYQEWSAESEMALSDIIRMNIRSQQNLPARRRAYRRGRGRSRIV